LIDAVPWRLPKATLTVSCVFSIKPAVDTLLRA
jgi:hypothetical protein